MEKKRHINNYAIIPLSTLETAFNIKYRSSSLNIYTLNVLKHVERDDEIYNLINAIKRDGFHGCVITSKTAVKIIMKYLYNSTDLIRKLFKRVYAIGPATAREVSKYAKDIHIKTELYIPESHNSTGLIDILDENRRYLLISSDKVDEKLANLILISGGVIARIYSIEINLNALRGILTLLGNNKFKNTYFLFTSLSSSSAWLKLKRLDENGVLYRTNLYAIAISKRVSMSISRNDFIKIYINMDKNIDKFPEFIRGVVKLDPHTH